MNKVRKISFRISEDDWNVIHQKAEQARMSLKEYITRLCIIEKLVFDLLSKYPILHHRRNCLQRTNCKLC